MKPEFYSIETFQKIMSLEESRGRLKDFCYSLDTQVLSLEIKELRNEFRKQHKDQREELQQQLEDLTKQYEERKRSEIVEAYNKVVHGKYNVLLREVEAKGKDAYADFPAPFSPTRAWISPLRSCKVMLSLAMMPGNLLVIFTISMRAYFNRIYWNE